MLVMDVHLTLGGVYSATDFNRRGAPEWPPHPFRLFEAMVNEWGEGGEDPAETAALEWLEGQPPPAVLVPESAYPQTLDEVVTRYVPPGYKPDGKDKGKYTFPGRVGHDRTFPEVRVDGAKFQFAWESPEPDASTRAALDALAGRVVRLGHSSSRVACRLLPAGTPPDSGLDRWAPVGGPGPGVRMLRSARPGTLADLVGYHRAWQAEKVDGRGPRPGADHVHYSTGPDTDRPSGNPDRTLTEAWRLVFRVGPGSGKAHLSDTAAVTEAALGALLHHMPGGCPEDVMELIAGHQPGGGPAEVEHPMFLALPFVGSAHADGQIKGIEIRVPYAAGEQVWEWTQKAAVAWDRSGRSLAFAGRALNIQRVKGPVKAAALSERRWSGGGQGVSVWVSAIPVVLPRSPGKLASGGTPAAWARAKNMLSAHLQGRLGLPEPAEIRLSLSPLALGAHPVKGHPRFVRGKGKNRMAKTLVHARITFPRPVVGPLVVGAGRYRGMGLMIPADPPTGDEGGPR